MKTPLFICLALLAGASAAHAQMAVHDNPTFMQAQQTASHTAQIMNSNEKILNTVNQTLVAVTGNRSTGSLSSMGLGGGFQMSSVPELGSLLGGGGLSMNGLGSYGALASDIINGLNLVKTLTGGSSAGAPTDQAYSGAVNTSAAVTAAVAGGQAASTARSSAFQGAQGQIGSSADIKASVDQNSQIQTQTGLTINELIGSVNLTNASLNAQQQQDLAAQSKLSNMMSFDASKATLVGQ